MQSNNTDNRKLRPRNQQTTAPAEKEFIQLLVVLEINRRKRQDDQTNYSDWTKVEIPKQDADSMLRNDELNGFIHLEITDDHPTRPGMRRVRMQEMVL